MSTPPPNVVLFISHDTGRLVSPCGATTVHTPNCARLAAEGICFSNAFCTSPLCSPSRASITTGAYPHQNGVMGLASEHFGGFDFAPGIRHAATLFGSGGYESVLCGFEHESPDCTRLGFDRTLSGPGRGTNGPGDSRSHAGAIKGWLQGRDRSRPFYLQIGTHETHLDWDAYGTQPDESHGVFLPPSLHDTAEVRSAIAQLQGAVRRLDDVLGQVLEALDQTGVADDTVFVFTTDHGIDLPLAKGTFYDAGLGVFLFMRYPRGGWCSPATRGELVSHVDVLPTLLECCRLPVPSQVSGKSLLPLLQGRLYEARPALFAEKTFHDEYEPVRAVRTSRFKYIRYFEAHFHHDLRTATIGQRHWIRHRHLLQRRWVEELFDLRQDPTESHNLVRDPVYAGELQAMRDRLATWMRETRDPLCDGPVESPRFKRLRERFFERA
jgi:N-sulfoglucosamine sulfohydrolase